MTQIQQFFKDIQPILALVSALLSVTVIGFIIKLTLFMKEALSQRVEALKDKNAVTEERRLKELEDRVRVEKERDEPKHKLAAILEREEITVPSLVANPMLTGMREEVADAVRSMLLEMQKVGTATAPEMENPDDYLELAKASTIAGNWLSAARHYDEYVRVHGENWEVHFLRAVAYSNARRGKTTDLASLKAYGDAIVLIPEGLDLNTRARFYTYRGAMFKRLGRLDEALADLLLAQKWASESNEVVDNQYNLACVYAMQKDKKNMMQCLAQLTLAPQYKHAIRHSPYFKNFREDEDFLDWLE